MSAPHDRAQILTLMGGSPSRPCENAACFKLLRDPGHEPSKPVLRACRSSLPRLSAELRTHDLPGHVAYPVNDLLQVIEQLPPQLDSGKLSV
jgi:hypothetical protein